MRSIYSAKVTAIGGQAGLVRSEDDLLDWPLVLPNVLGGKVWEYSLHDGCPMLRHCTRSRNRMKIVTRHVWRDCRDRIDRRFGQKRRNIVEKYSKSYSKRLSIEPGVHTCYFTSR